MTKKFDRQAYRNELDKRTEEAANRRDDTGQFGSFIKKDSEIILWKCNEGEHIVDIIPYIAGNDNPHVKEGNPAYSLEIWVHRNIGINEDWVICPARTYGKKCPICEEQRRLKHMDEESNEEIIGSLKPSRRVIYNVIVYDTQKEENLGVQVWEVAHWNIERHLTSLAKNPRGGGFILFADPDEGKSLSFVRQGSGRNDTQYIGHKLIDRDYQIEDELLEATVCLDDIIELRTYEELQELFEGNEDQTSGASEQKPEEEPEEKSTRQRHHRTQKEDPPEEVKTNDCPGNGKFGTDIDRLKECDTCDKWDDCAKEADKLGV